MAAKDSGYALSDKVLTSMAIEHLAKTVDILRRSQDPDKISPHISAVRKVKSGLEDVYRKILQESV